MKRTGPPAEAARPTPELHSKESLALDADLVRWDTAEARDEIQRRVEWRRRNRMNVAGLIRPKHLERSSETTLEMLSDLGIRIADDEIERRRLAKEQAA